MQNIFSSLVKYKPQPNMTPVENYFTEGLRFILSSSEELLTDFVRLIAGENNIFEAPFTLDSQIKYGSSIIDLQITDSLGKKILVEIKVWSKENKYIEDEDGEIGQVEKYLRLNEGYVCFIANEENEITVKNNTDKYLGQFEWFEVYQVMDNFLKKNKLNEISSYFISNFLAFMTELSMQPFEGFDKNDIEVSQQNYFGFLDKLSEFLRYITKDKRIKSFLKNNELEIISNTPKFFEKHNQIILFLGNKKRYGNKKIELGFGYNGEDSAEDGSLIHTAYYQGINCDDSSYAEFKKKIEQLNINSDYFDDFESDGYWVASKEVDFKKFVKLGEKRAADFVFESLLEIEKSGALKLMEEEN